jgi:hypothetical protein
MMPERRRGSFGAAALTLSCWARGMRQPVGAIGAGGILSSWGEWGSVRNAVDFFS